MLHRIILTILTICQAGGGNDFRQGVCARDALTGLVAFVGYWLRFGAFRFSRLVMSSRVQNQCPPLLCYLVNTYLCTCARQLLACNNA